MARNYILVLKIINILVFVSILFIFLSIFHFDAVITTSDGELVLTSFLNSLKNISSYLVFAAAYGVAFCCVFIASFAQPSLLTLLDDFFRRFFSLWFTFPNGTTPQLNEIPDLLGQEFAIFNENVYLIAFQILFIVTIFYAIKAFLKTDPKNDIIVIGSIVLMLVIPLIVFGLKDMLDLFYVSIPYLEGLPYPLDPSLEQIPIDNIFQFFGSPVILLAIVSYIYLELAFQINYTYTVTRPSFERRLRLEAQLHVLESESHYITANVDKIKEEAKARRLELEIEEKATIGKFFAKTGEKFSFVKEMIERKPTMIANVPTLYINISTHKDRKKIPANILKDVKFKVKGCPAAIATGSMLTTMAKGKTVEDALKITEKDIEDALDGLPPGKSACSNIGVKALHEAMKTYYKNQKQSTD